MFAVINRAERADVALDRDWGAVFAASVGLIFSVGVLMLYSFGIFVRPLTAEFGWSRTELSGAVAIYSYSLAFSAPIWGWLIDRYGPRAVMLPSVIMLSALLASLALLTPHLWHFYLVFAAIPLLSGGASPLGYSAVLVRQFDRKLGQALGLALMGVGLGGAIIPPLAQALNAAMGWRGAYAALGALTLIVSLPAVFLATNSVRPLAPVVSAAHNAAVGAALRTRSFALICTIFILLGLITVGALAHLVPMMIDRGFSAPAAAQVAAMTGLAAVIARGVLGWLLDRFHAPYLLAAIAALSMLAFVLLAYGDTTAFGYVAAALLGVVVGAEVDFISFLVRRYFAPALFGRLYGMAFGLYLAGTGTGPLLMGASFDHLGGYQTGLLCFVVVSLAVVGLTAMLPSYDSPTREVG